MAPRTKPPSITTTKCEPFDKRALEWQGALQAYSLFCWGQLFAYLLEHIPGALNLDLCLILWVEQCENFYGMLLSQDSTQRYLGQLANLFILNSDHELIPFDPSQNS